MNRTRTLILAAGLSALAIFGIASRGDTTGVASHDLKKDSVSARLVSSGIDTVSVTCPDGGVALFKGLDNTDIYAEPFYYHVSGTLSESGHVVTATLGADYDDSTAYDVTLRATCVSLDS